MAFYPRVTDHKKLVITVLFTSFFIHSLKNHLYVYIYLLIANY